MANPRAGIGLWEEEGAEFQTFTFDDSSITYDVAYSGGSDVVGRAVTFNAAAGVIALAADAEFVLGRLVKVESDGKCTVQTKGIMELPGGAAAGLTLGKAIVGAASAAPANGYIREVDTAVAAELGVMQGHIWEATTTTAVVVKL
jgi:hypothetical protein